LLNLLERTKAPARFIVIDNLSDDGTWEWLQTIEDSRLELHQPRKQQHHFENNNFGLEFVKSELFVTTIDKMVIFNYDWLEVEKKAMRENSELRAVIPSAPTLPGSRFEGTLLGSGLIQTSGSFGAYYRMQRKSDVERMGGFQPVGPWKLHSEDDGFTQAVTRLGGFLAIHGDLRMMNLLHGAPFSPDKLAIFEKRYSPAEIDSWLIWKYMERFLKNGTYELG